MNSTTHCKLCKEEIKKDALVCVHCSNYQNWKRYLNFSSIIFSLIIAAFTIFGFTYPYLKEKLQPLKTELNATLMGTTSKHLYLLVSNTGNRPGSIKDIIVTEYGYSRKIKTPGGTRISIQADSLEEFQVIEPRESKIVELLFDGPLIFPEYYDNTKLNMYKSICTLRINAVAFDGSLTKEIDILYACIPQTLKEQWQKEVKAKGDVIVTKLPNLDNMLKHRPELSKLIEEYSRMYPSPQDDFFGDLDDNFK